MGRGTAIAAPLIRRKLGSKAKVKVSAWPSLAINHLFQLNKKTLFLLCVNSQRKLKEFIGLRENQPMHGASIYKIGICIIVRVSGGVQFMESRSWTL